MSGQYRSIEPNERGWLWSGQLQLFLGVHEGKARFFTPEGNLVLLPEEAMSQQLEQERQRAEQAERELARLRALLGENGR